MMHAKGRPRRLRWKDEIGGVPLWIAAVGVFVAAMLVVVPLTVRSMTPAGAPYVRPSGSLDYEAKPVMPTVVFIGDSFTGGSDMGGNGEANWTLVASRALEWNGCKFGVGGSGWVQAPNGWSYGARVDWAIAMRPSLIVFSNGINDVKGPAPKIGPAATEALAYLRAKDSNVPVLVIGPMPLQDFPALHVMNDGVRDAARANNAVFIDAVAGRWFAGDDHRYVGADGFHPTDAGHEYLAKKFAEAVAEAGIQLAKVPREERVPCNPPNASAVRPDGSPVKAGP